VIALFVLVAGGVMVMMPVPLRDSISSWLAAIVPFAIFTPLEIQF
jgi:hypothetical protein